MESWLQKVVSPRVYSKQYCPAQSSDEGIRSQRLVAIGSSDPGLWDGLGWRWGWLVAGSCLPCRCVHSFVSHFKSRQEREAELGVRAMEFTNVYVKNLQMDIDEQGLEELFSQFGECVSRGSLGSLSLLLPSQAGRKGPPGLSGDLWEERATPWGFRNSPLSQVGPSQGRR